MNMFDEARSFAVMIKMRNLSQSELAKMLGVSQSYIANKLRLLQLDENLQEKIISAGLTERHARALLRLDEDRREAALDEICRRGLSVTESEALVDFLRSTSAPRRIGQADRLNGIDIFLKNIKDSLDSLSSIGVSSSRKISYHGSKMLITISIDESR